MRAGLFLALVLCLAAVEAAKRNPLHKQLRFPAALQQRDVNIPEPQKAVDQEKAQGAPADALPPAEDREKTKQLAEFFKADKMRTYEETRQFLAKERQAVEAFWSELTTLPEHFPVGSSGRTYFGSPDEKPLQPTKHVKATKEELAAQIELYKNAKGRLPEDFEPGFLLIKAHGEKGFEEVKDNKAVEVTDKEDDENRKKKETLLLETEAETGIRNAIVLYGAGAGIPLIYETWANRNNANFQAAGNFQLRAIPVPNDAAMRLVCAACPGGHAAIDIGSVPGRWRATQFQRPIGGVGALTCFRAQFKALGAGAWQQDHVYCGAPAQVDNFIWYLHTTVWRHTNSGPVVPVVKPKAAAKPNPIANERPGWASYPAQADFGYGWEMEGSALTILLYYKPIGLATPLWTALTLAQRTTLVQCYLYGGTWHNAPNGGVGCGAGPAGTIAAFHAAMAGVLGTWINGDFLVVFINWEVFENCGAAGCMDAAYVHPIVGGPPDCAGPGAQAVWAEHLHQEGADYAGGNPGGGLWEVTRDGSTNALATAIQEVKCFGESVWSVAAGGAPTSMHIHASFRPPRSRKKVKEVVAYLIWLNDVFTAEFSSDVHYLGLPFFSTPDRNLVTATMASLDQGMMLVESNDGLGTNWGNFKNGFISLRHGLYGHNRIGVEFRVGLAFADDYHALAYAGAPVYPAGVAGFQGRLTHTRQIISHLLSVLRQNGFDHDAPVHVFPGNAPYSISSVYHNIVASRRGSSCKAKAPAGPGACDVVDHWPAYAALAGPKQAAFYTEMTNCFVNFRPGKDKTRHYRKVMNTLFTSWENIDIGQGKPAAATAIAARNGSFNIVNGMPAGMPKCAAKPAAVNYMTAVAGQIATIRAAAAMRNAIWNHI